MKMTDIAKKAGVSIATVSRVINNEKNVREATRKKVQEIIKEFEYTPSAIGRNLSKKETNIIAVIVPDISNPFFSEIVEGITQKADENGLGMILFSTTESPEKQERALNMALEQRVKGIIISVTRESYEDKSGQLEKLRSKGIPVTLVDRDLKHSSLDGVFMDNIGGADKGVECLIKNGHRDIAIITGPVTSKPGRDRLLGYKRALTREEIEIRDENIYEGDFQMESGYQIGCEILKRKIRPSGIFICNNQMTLGFIKAMNEMGCSTPEDISVASFDRVEILEYFGINLTTISTSVRELGIKSTEILLDRIRENKEAVEADEVRRIILSPKLEKRGSEKYIERKNKEDI